MLNLNKNIFSLNDLNTKYGREFGIYWRFCIINNYSIGFESMERFTFLYLNSGLDSLNNVYWIFETKLHYPNMMSYSFNFGQLAIIETTDLSIVLDKILSLLRIQIKKNSFKGEKIKIIISK